MGHVIYEKGTTIIHTIVNKDGRCALTGEFKDGRMMGENKTVKEYLKELGPGFVCIPFDEALKKIEKLQEEHYIADWEEISKDYWFFALESLPPEKWKTVNGIEFFRMMEKTTGHITRHYARYQNRYFAAYRKLSDDYSRLSDEIRCLISRSGQKHSA